MPDWLLALDLHNEMLGYYRKQEWNKAMNLVMMLKGEFDCNMDHYYDIWLDRIEDMKNADLPEDWSGTYVATSK